MAQVNLPDYKNLYLQTAKEYVASLLVNYNKLLNDFQDKDALNQIHLAAHSLKSQSQVMGLTDIASLSANIEKASDDIMNGVGKIDDAFIVLLKKSMDDLNLDLASIDKGVV